jgi:hypothetical protein
MGRTAEAAQNLFAFDEYHLTVGRETHLMDAASLPCSDAIPMATTREVGRLLQRTHGSAIFERCRKAFALRYVQPTLDSTGTAGRNSLPI